MKKSIIGLFTLCSISMLGAFSLTNSNSITSVSADSGTCGYGVDWSIQGEKLIISGNGYMQDYDYKGTPWYYNESRGEYGCDYIKVIEIQEGVKSICQYAFYDFDELEYLTLPTTLESIGYEAFYHCDKIEKIYIPSPVNNLSIGNESFMKCFALKTLQIGDLSVAKGKITLVEECFENCEALNSVFISKNVSEIRSEAFNDCRKLTSVYYDPSFNYSSIYISDSWNYYFINAVTKSIDEIPFVWHYYADRRALETNSFADFYLVKETHYDVPNLDHDSRFHWYSLRGNTLFKECHTYEGNYCKYCHQKKETFEDESISWSNTELNTGFYVVDNNVDLNHLSINVKGDVSIIVKDECTLSLDGGILMEDGASLSIYAEHIVYNPFSNKTGRIRVSSSACMFNPAIGPKDNCTATNLYIYGCNIDAHGNNAPGIGSYGNNSTVSIFGGTTNCVGTGYAAGLGSCDTGSDGGTGVGGIKIFNLSSSIGTISSVNITIYSGDVRGEGALYAAGIGSGYNGSSNIRIFGGYVEGGSYSAAGIGGKDSYTYIYDGYVFGHGSGNDIGGFKQYLAEVYISPDFNGTLIGYLNPECTKIKGNENYMSTTGSFISSGSIIIISVVAGVALITAGIFMTLYFVNRKKVNKN